MQQQSLFTQHLVAPPERETPREKGRRLAKACAQKAGEDFYTRACAFVLSYLGKHPVASGELITDACKLAGIRAHDDRAMGAVYGALSRRGLIEPCGDCPRKKGHGTSGGRLWRLKTAGGATQ